MTKEEKVHEFIGSRFGEGGHLEVVGWSGDRSKSRSKIYIAHCSECGKDPELFGDAIFRCSKGTLVRGVLPCGCSKRYHWSENQYKIRLERWCSVRGYSFNGFLGCSVSANTKIRLQCLKDNHVWESCTVSKALHCDTGCPKCKYVGISKINSIKSTIPDNEATISYKETGKFEGFIFRRSHEKFKSGLHYWEVECPVCSYDKYVRQGLCSGVFLSSMSNLRLGRKPCRCGPSYHWTPAQRKFQIESIINKENLNISFKEFAEDYCGSSTKIKMTCGVHGDWEVSINNFINKQTRCPSCATSGFNRERTGFVYILKIAGGLGFTGYGITNNTVERLKTHSRNLSRKGFTIIAESIFKMDGQDAVDIEKAIKDNFKRFPQVVEGFITEATYENLYSDMTSFVHNQIKERYEYALPHH